MCDIDSNITFSNPLIQDFPSLVSKFRDALDNDNSQDNSQRIGVLILRHSDRPIIHDNETMINKKGIDRIQKYREILSSKGISIDTDFIFSSPVIRCVQTAAGMAHIDESKVHKVRWITGSPWNHPNEDEVLSSRKIWVEMKYDFGSEKSREIWLKGGLESEGLIKAEICGEINYQSIFNNVLIPLALKCHLDKSKIADSGVMSDEGSKINPIAICCTHDICIIGLASILQSKTTFVPFLGGIFLCFDFDPAKYSMENL